jgi:TetR/AcrR family transcriptional regulator, mexJK operon transcriptional repressor
MPRRADPASTATAPRGRPPDEEKRAAIADAARRLFLERGYEGMTIEGAAAAAGVSKVTVYRAFVDRAGLLASVVQRESESMEAALDALSLRGVPADERLVAFGARLLRHLARPEVQAFDRRMAAEADRHPDLVRAFFEAGPARIRARLAGMVVEARLAAEGLQAFELAEEMMAAWAGAVPLEMRFGLDGPPRKADVERRLRRIVGRFAV